MIEKLRTETIVKVDSNIDLGNLHIKAVGFNENDEMIMESLPNLVETRETLNPKAKMLEFDGRKIFLGCGTKNNNVLKHKRDFLVEQVLVMTCVLYPNSDNLDVNLKLGLPPEQYAQRQYQQELLDKFKLGETYDFKLDGRNKRLKISNIQLCIEGYSAFVALADNINYNGRDLLICDIGGGTTDACSFTYDFDSDQFIPGIPTTVTKGCIDMIEEITKKINSVHGADIKSEQVDVYIRKDKDELLYGDNSYVISEFVDVAKDTANLIYNKFNNEYGSWDNYLVILVGGGHKLFNKLVSEKISNQLELDETERFFANAIGFALQ